MNSNRSSFNEYLVTQLIEKVNVLSTTLYQLVPLHEVFNLHGEKPLFSPYQFQEIKDNAYALKPKECCSCNRAINLSDAKKCEYFTVCTGNKFCYQDKSIVK